VSRKPSHPKYSDARPAPAAQGGFLAECVRLKIDHLRPLKQIDRAAKESRRFKQIVASVRIVGLVEPPAVAKDKSRPGYFLLVDGHLRVEALKSLGAQEVDCMLVSDEDIYTYNKRVNRPSLVQDHKMIARAIELGVPKARIAEVLGLSLDTVHKRSRLLAGICDEAAEILACGPCPMIVFDLFRKLNPTRQIEGAEIMRKSNNFSAGMARAILATSEPDQLVSDARRVKKAVTAQSVAEVEGLLQRLRVRNKADDPRISNDALTLEMIKQYIVSLLSRKAILHWLANNEKTRGEGLAEIAEVRVSFAKSTARRAVGGKLRHI
jgi:hypothetical protein